jgi:hypothetical protein
METARSTVMEQRRYQLDSQAGSMWVITVDGKLFAYVNGTWDETNKLVEILNRSAAALRVFGKTEPDLSTGKGNIKRYEWDRT